MYFLLATVPIYLYLGVLVLMDCFSLLRRDRVLMAMGLGMLACGVTVGVALLVGDHPLIPALEEVLKGLVVLWLVRSRKAVFAIDAVLYGAAVGGGFGLLENIIFSYLNSDMTVWVALFRGMGTAIMHMGLTGMLGVWLVSGNALLRFVPALLPSIGLHYLFNMFLINPILLLFIDLLCFTAIFAILFDKNVTAIHKWLDNTFVSDVQLLAAMRRGQFTQTPSGRYLLSVREQFKPEVFMDMYCYVMVYLELSIIAKRNLLLAEAGLSTPQSLPENQPQGSQPQPQEEKVQALRAEFKALRKRIGKTGQIALAPLVPMGQTPLLQGGNRLVGALALTLAVALVAGSALLPLGNQARAQTLYHYQNKDLELLFFDKNISQYVPHMVKMHAQGKAFHHQLWNRAPLDSACSYIPERSTLYLTDWADDGNAGVSALPYNLIMVGLAPLNNSFYVFPAVERFNHLFNHEQTHVVMADKYTPADARWRRAFGAKITVNSQYPLTSFWSYFTTPRWYAPRWYHEGIACFMETWLGGGVGRALGGYDEMYFRSIVDQDRELFSVVGLETEGTTSDFQVGTNAYLYGTRFVNYLAYRYGVDSLFRFYNRTPDSYRFFARQFKHVYGQNLRSAWDEWRTFERAHQKENLETLAEYPLTATQPLTGEALGSASPLVYDAKRDVAYVAMNHPGHFAYVGALSLKDGRIRPIAKVDGPMLYQTAYVAFDPNQDRLFVTTHNGGMRGLRVYDVNTGRRLKNINYTRVGDIVYDPVQDRLYGVRNNAGVASVVYFDKDLEKVRILYSFPFGQSLSDLTVSHSGTHLVATLYGPLGEQTLIRLDVAALENAQFGYDKLFTLDDTNLSQFRYSLDDKTLYGSSYYNGVPNIWRLDPASGDFELMSNVQVGLFAPLQVSADTLLAFRFERDGMRPVKMGIQPLEDANAISYLGQEAFERNPSLTDLPVLQKPLDYSFEDVYKDIQVYKPFRQLRFTGAYPDVTGYKNTVALGYRFMFQDRVGLHRLNFYVGFSPWSHNPWKERFHFNLNWAYWNWTLDAYYNNSHFYDLFGPFKTSRAGYKVGLSYDKNFTLLAPFNWGWGASVATYGMMDALPLFQNIPSPVSEMQTASAYVNISKTRTSLGGVMAESGYKLSVNGYTYLAQKQLFPQLYLTYDQGFLLPLMRNTSFWLRSAVGQSFGDADSAFGNDYFGGFRNNWVDYRTPYQYRNASALPGVAIDAISAHSFAKLTGEFNLKPFRFNNFGFLWLYPTYAQLSAFSTYLLADAWGGVRATKNFVNLGAQLNVEVVLFNYLKTTWSVGYAYLLHETLLPGSTPVGLRNGQWMFSLKLL